MFDFIYNTFFLCSFFYLSFCHFSVLLLTVGMSIDVAMYLLHGYFIRIRFLKARKKIVPPFVCTVYSMQFNVWILYGPFMTCLDILPLLLTWPVEFCLDKTSNSEIIENQNQIPPILETEFTSTWNSRWSVYSPFNSHTPITELSSFFFFVQLTHKNESTRRKFCTWFEIGNRILQLFQLYNVKIEKKNVRNSTWIWLNLILIDLGRFLTLKMI